MGNTDNQLDAPSSNVHSSNLVRSEGICSLDVTFRCSLFSCRSLTLI